MSTLHCMKGTLHHMKATLHHMKQRINLLRINYYYEAEAWIR